MTVWPVEEIPNEDGLFYRVPVGQLRRDLQVAPGIFKENKGSMSADWERYSTAAQTRARQGTDRASTFAVLKMNVGSLRGIEGLSVVHAPIQPSEGYEGNRAHTNIFGIEVDLGQKERIRVELHERFNTWEIPPGAGIE